MAADKMYEDHLVKVKLILGLGRGVIFTLGWGWAVWKPTLSSESTSYLYPREKLVTLEVEPFIFKVPPCDLGY